MNCLKRPTSLAETAGLLRQGASMTVLKDFYHEFWEHPSSNCLQDQPDFSGLAQETFLRSYFQAIAEYFSQHLKVAPPAWTKPVVRAPEPWFASPGAAIRNFLLISSPTPFRARDIFITEDTLSAI